MKKVKRVKKAAILDFVESRVIVSRSELIKFIVELTGNTYDKKTHRGHYSNALCPHSKNNYFLCPSCHDRRYLVRVDRGKYAVRYSF